MWAVQERRVVADEEQLDGLPSLPKPKTIQKIPTSTSTTTTTITTTKTTMVLSVISGMYFQYSISHWEQQQHHHQRKQQRQWRQRCNNQKQQNTKKLSMPFKQCSSSQFSFRASNFKMPAKLKLGMSDAQPAGQPKHWKVDKKREMLTRAKAWGCYQRAWNNWNILNTIINVSYNK